MEPGYTVAVIDGGMMSSACRIKLEVRFARELERALGGPDELTAMCLALQACQRRRDDDEILSQRWLDAVCEAAGATSTSGVRFDVRIATSLQLASGR